MSFAKSIKIPTYNQQIVNSNEKALKYSKYFGKPASTDCCMLSKSKIKHRATTGQIISEIMSGKNPN